ncbi:MAG: lipid-A-disaccharide synthase, partial [Puniceicoccales bacterium]|nr:lipid-A-disaccharide synthase [Puniceicoccales bacterium]
MSSEFDLDSPHKKVDLLVIAGEHSGDQHAAAVVKELKLQHPELNICSFGGRCSSDVGAHLILDITKFAVVGFAEVVLRCIFFKKLLKKIVAWIEKHKPLVICLVDYPGLNLRIARMLFEKQLSAKAGGTIKLFYYISPQVWAWKRERRFELEKYVD